MPRTIFPFDEVNAFRQNLRDFHLDPRTGRIKSRDDCDDIIDEMLDLFLLAYENGNRAINEQFGGNYEPPVDDVEKTILLKIDGKTWVDRVNDWYEQGGTEGDIMRIVETEAHRDGNTAADDTAVANGAKMKTWRTMEDDRVRDTHDYLFGTTIPIDADFYVYTGDHARAPGLFSDPSENCGCRCYLEYN